MFLLFLRFLPLIATSEVKGITHRPTRIIRWRGQSKGGASA